MESLEGKKILVTGGTGYLGSHCVKRLLNEGAVVTTTVRDLKNKKKNDPLVNLVPEKKNNLTLKQGELTDNKVWSSIVEGHDMVLHLASPVFFSDQNAESQIEQAIQGVKNVLNACVEHNIPKVVMTSSIASMMPNQYSNRSFKTKEDWACSEGVKGYTKSKTLAEREAWKIYFRSRGKLNLTMICPGLVLGEYIMPNYTESSKVIMEMFKAPALVSYAFSTVSIQSVVDAHVNSLKKPDLTRGKRYVLVENTYWFEDMVRVLRERYEKEGYKFPKYHAPYLAIKMMSMVQKDLKNIVDGWNVRNEYDTAETTKDLEIKWRYHRDYILESAQSLIERGFIKQLQK